MSSEKEDGSRADRLVRRRSYTAAEKLEFLAGYEAACERQAGGAYLRAEGLYSSHMSEWRKLRDTGMLTATPQPPTDSPTGGSTGGSAGGPVGGPAGGSVGGSAGRVLRPSPEQVEIARLRRELAAAERRLDTTQTALSIMGKAHALLEQISQSAEPDNEPRPGRR